MFSQLKAHNLKRKKYIHDARRENAHNNMKNLLYMTTATAALMILLVFGTPFIIDDWRPSAWHLLFILAMLVFWVIVVVYYKTQKGKRNPKTVTFLCILFEILVFSFVALIDAESERNAPSNYITMLLVCLPVLFAMPFSISYGITAFFGAAYLAAVYYWKDTAVLRQRETIKIICALFFSVVVEEMVFAIYMKEYESRVKYEQLSIRDPLLQELYNKQSGQERICSYLKQTPDVSAALIIMDLDNFKYVNDTYGHYKGDGVLQCTGRVLTYIFDKTDIVARFGGDEFMVLISRDAAREELLEMCERLNHMLHETVMKELEVSVSSSIGVLKIENQRVDSFDAMFCQADMVLYEAKNKGKNCVAIRKYDEAEAANFARGQRHNIYDQRHNLAER